jgi:hypothetical protein
MPACADGRQAPPDRRGTVLRLQLSGLVHFNHARCVCLLHGHLAAPIFNPIDPLVGVKRVCEMYLNICSLKVMHNCAIKVIRTLLIVALLLQLEPRLSSPNRFVKLV